MRFSELFSIADARKAEWFDPILSLDTQLFIDPFLIYDNEKNDFVGSHAEVIALFDSVFRLIAQSGGDPQSAYWTKAHGLLLFPEVEELCLGYTGQGTGGAGSGSEVATDIARSIWNAIRQGVQSLRHFEEVQLFSSSRTSGALATAARLVCTTKIKI